ncbi:MAG: hypothetical protein A4E52_02147 [Pelotomaculum sp. PtaB.Bin013]|nr:MAG: hypothetical protein A4E52_02147 [Pelotomaculum sp. PtaB.Bin013]
MVHVFAPYDDPKELYANLPDKWETVNKVRLPSGKDCPAFIAKMEPPSAFVRSREKGLSKTVDGQNINHGNDN